MLNCLLIDDDLKYSFISEVLLSNCKIYCFNFSRCKCYFINRLNEVIGCSRNCLYSPDKVELLLYRQPHYYFLHQLKSLPFQLYQIPTLKPWDIAVLKSCVANTKREQWSDRRINITLPGFSIVPVLKFIPNLSDSENLFLFIQNSS